MLVRFRGRELDPHYLAYFECFNQELFFEAHEVLEVLWLGQRQGPNGAFYKGLIQLAGAFVHLQKQRPEPARALFQLALGNLAEYPALHEQLNLTRVREVIKECWLRLATEGRGTERLREGERPKLALLT
jgi:predicted metal-dependent hydrolase